MTEGRFAKTRELFEKARDLAPNERASLLDEACEEDDELRRDVEELLDTHDGGTITLGVEGDSPEKAEAWNALIDQLRERGPGHTRYVFEGELARGGMGVIHRVFDRDARRRLALKVMLGRGAAPASGETPDVADASLGRFLEEAQVTSQLDHPGIVPVHEIGVDETEQVYFTMKLVKGDDLRTVFDRVADPNDDEWTTTRALNVMLRVCEAMAYAHTKGVIHRDLKPGNVMVGKFGEAYVMDWGLAKVLGQEDAHDLRFKFDSTSIMKTDRKDAAADTPDTPLLTMDGDVVGTPAYMPPEQAEGRTELLGPPADVYAVGAMLYHLIAGHMPYVRPGAKVSARTILGLVLNGPPSALTEKAKDVPPELLAIVEKAMAREIADRYPDMTALARDLRSFLEQRVVAAYESGAWAELRKWVQRNKALAMTSAAAMFAVMVVAGWALSERQTARNNERQADTEKQIAEAERDRVLRLSDKLRLDLLVAEAPTLPCHPAAIGDLRRWLADADRLLKNLPRHEQALAQVRSVGTPSSILMDATLDALRMHHDTHVRGEVPETESDLFLPGDGPDDDEALRRHLDDLAHHLAETTAAVARERDYEFGDSVEDQWWHDTVRDLVVGLHALKADKDDGVTLKAVRLRSEQAAGLTNEIPWEEARTAVRDHPLYGGLDLLEQPGLTPLGPDPRSTLWEFGHSASGAVSVRHPDTDDLQNTEEFGIVLVLVPGGSYVLGAQSDDSEAAHFDPDAEPREAPVRNVELGAFFISKYEVTRAQWTQLSGSDPSWWTQREPRRGSPDRPVDNVGYDAAQSILSSAGLRLPTESEWESACRALSATPWSFGRSREAFALNGNIKDLSFDQVAPHSTLDRVDGLLDRLRESLKPPESRLPDGRTSRVIISDPVDDGHYPPARVGLFLPNDFGLHDMHGNVAEWCVESSVPGNDSRLPGEFRICRGGSYASVSDHARVSSHNVAFREELGGSRKIGVRAARTVSQ